MTVTSKKKLDERLMCSVESCKLESSGRRKPESENFDVKYGYETKVSVCMYVT